LQVQLPWFGRRKSWVLAASNWNILQKYNENMGSYGDDSGIPGELFAVIMGSNQTWLGNLNGGF